MTSSPPESLPSRVGDLVRWARLELKHAGADSPRSTALALLEHATRIRREAAMAHPESNVPPDDLQRFGALVGRRCGREPLAYIVGSREFYGRAFDVSPASLIPRPETEGLVDLALARIAGAPWGSVRVLDIGTGTGAIAVTILAERPGVSVVGTDIDVEALGLARRNAVRHRVDKRLALVATTLVHGLRGLFPLVVANLPYVPSWQIDTLEPEVRCYEPRHALDGGPTGTEVITALLDALDTFLAPGGTALLEFGDGQAELLRARLAQSSPKSRVAVERDAFGNERYLIVERAGPHA